MGYRLVTRCLCGELIWPNRLTGGAYGWAHGSRPDSPVNCTIIGERGARKSRRKAGPKGWKSSLQQAS